VLANPVFSPIQSPESASPGAAPAAASGEEQLSKAQQQRSPSPSQRSSLLQAAAQQQAQQAQEEHHWHVDVVLASHDAELAGVKEAVSRLESAQQASSAIAEDTALHVSALDDWLRALEHSYPVASGLAVYGAAVVADSAPVAGSTQGPLDHTDDCDTDLEATLSRGVGLSGPAPCAESTSASSALPASSRPAHDFAAILEKLTVDATHTSSRMTALEAASAKQQQEIESTRSHAMQLQGDLHEVGSRYHLGSPTW
jgi:hypothetical protein